MKKCGYCGAEYPDEALHCVTDGEPLPGGPPQMPPVSDATSIPGPSESFGLANPPAAPSSVKREWTEYQLRVFEICLVCMVAFGGSILSSVELFAMHTIGHGASYGSNLSVFNASLRQAASLALLWYVLRRRSRTFSNLGFRYTVGDVAWSVPLYIATALLRHFSYLAFYKATNGMGPVLTVLPLDYAPAGFLVRAGFHILNPLFEELIVRAYLMTEVRELTGSATKAVILSTALQTSYHLYQGGPSAMSLALVFLIFSLCYAKTGRIVPIILAHLYTDFLGTAWLSLHHIHS